MRFINTEMRVLSLSDLRARILLGRDRQTSQLNLTAKSTTDNNLKACPELVPAERRNDWIEGRCTDTCD